MTIHSMPNNKKFEANYDRIFKKRVEVEYFPNRYFRILGHEWVEVFNAGWPLHAREDLFVVAHDYRIGYTIHAPIVAGTYYDLKDFQEALECCSRYAI